MSEQDNDQVIPTNDDVQNAPAVDTDDIASQLVLEPAEVSEEKPETKPAEDNAEKVEEAAPVEESEVKPTEPETPDEKPAEPQETEAERNRRFYEERQQQKRQVEQTIDQTYQPQPVDELTQHFIDQGYDEFQAQMLARDEVRNQRDQINEARTEVAELNMQIETEAVQVMHDFPVFNPGTPERPNPLYDKDFADKASELYMKAANAVVDPRTGLVVQTSLTPYTFYKQLADMRNSGVSQAQVKAQKAAEQQMAAVAPPVSNAPVVNKSKEDEQADGLAAALDAVR